MNRLSKKLVLSLLLGSSMATCVAVASSDNASASGKIQMSEDARQIIANQGGTRAINGVATLHDSIIEEKERYDWIFKNHPIFKTYLPKGNVVGKLRSTDRGYEFAHSGNGNEFQKYSKRKGLTSTMYRLPVQDALRFPNKWVGPKKCGECHAVQYEKWSRSRHQQLDFQVSIQNLVMS